MIFIGGKFIVARLRQDYRARLYMVLRTVNKTVFTVTIRLGCNMPKGYVDDTVRIFWHKSLPYREEHYPSLAIYWKIRLLK